MGFIAADLMDYSKFFHSNGGMRYILTAIDMYSRYAWAFPIKSKEPKEILPHLKSIHAELLKNKHNFITFTSDAGNEFKGVVKKWLDDNNIKQYLAYDQNDPDVKNRAAIIEGFNGQLSNRINKATYVLDSSNWVAALPQIMRAYNEQNPLNAKHEQPPPPKPDKVKIGDFVRIRNNPGIAKISAKKGLRGTSNYSDQVFRIISKNGNRYVLTDDEMKKILQSALARNLQVVSKASTKPTSLPQIKKEATKAKRFTKLQQDSKLDVDKKGKIVPPIVPAREKRAIKKPSYLKDYD